jgi:hypothetical protein
MMNHLGNYKPEYILDSTKCLDIGHQIFYWSSVCPIVEVKITCQLKQAALRMPAPKQIIYTTPIWTYMDTGWNGQYPRAG